MFISTFWLFIIGSAVVIYFLSKIKLPRRLQMDEMPPDPRPEETLKPIKFYDGPLKGLEEEVSEYKPRYYAPHIPEDEAEREVIGHVEMDGRRMEWYKPVFAEYVPVGDEGEYIFSRVLTEEEAIQLHEQGEL